MQKKPRPWWLKSLGWAAFSWLPFAAIMLIACLPEHWLAVLAGFVSTAWFAFWAYIILERDDPDPLAALLARAAADPFYLGCVLAIYQQRRDLTDSALAAELGCAPVVLPGLRQCRRPGAGDRTAEEDLVDIAGRFSIDAAALRRIVEAIPLWGGRLDG